MIHVNCFTEKVELFRLIPAGSELYEATQDRTLFWGGLTFHVMAQIFQKIWGPIWVQRTSWGNWKVLSKPSQLARHLIGQMAMFCLFAHQKAAIKKKYPFLP